MNPHNVRHSPWTTWHSSNGSLYPQISDYLIAFRSALKAQSSYAPPQ